MPIKNDLQHLPLTSLQDIIDVKSDEAFEQIIAELADDLRAMRQLAKRPGHSGFDWPILWRRSGPPSTITTHCPDGSTLPRPLQRTGFVVVDTYCSAIPPEPGSTTDSPPWDR